MNQIPNIEETHNTEVEEARQKLNKVYLRLAYGKSDIETAKREVDEILHHQLQKAREEAIAKHFTGIGMVHIKAFCKLLKSHHSKGNDIMYAVRRAEQYPFVFETNADVQKELDKYILSELDQNNK